MRMPTPNITMVYGQRGVMKNQIRTVGSSVSSLLVPRCLSPVTGKEFGIFYTCINDLAELHVLLAVAL